MFTQSIPKVELKYSIIFYIFYYIQKLNRNEQRDKITYKSRYTV